MLNPSNQRQGIFCPSLGAKFRPHSQSKIATYFPNITIMKSKKKIKKFTFLLFLETTTTYEKQWPIPEWYLNT